MSGFTGHRQLSLVTWQGNYSTSRIMASTAQGGVQWHWPLAGAVLTRLASTRQMLLATSTLAWGVTSSVNFKGTEVF
jgi:hypothetical protein